MHEDLVEAEFGGESPQERAEWLALRGVGCEVVGGAVLSRQAEAVVRWVQDAGDFMRRTGSRLPKPFVFPTGSLETRTLEPDRAGWAQVTHGLAHGEYGGIGVEYFTTTAWAYEAGPASPARLPAAQLGLAKPAMAKWLASSDWDPTTELVRLFRRAALLVEAKAGLIEWRPTLDPRVDLGEPRWHDDFDWAAFIPAPAWALVLGPGHQLRLEQAGRDLRRAPCALVEPIEPNLWYLQLTESLRVWDDSAYFRLGEFLAPVIARHPA